jgi:hypothetical protein
MRWLTLTLILSPLVFAQAVTVAQKLTDMYVDMAHVQVYDLWNADPVEDALEVARSESPYLLLPDRVVPAPIPPYTSIEDGECWVNSIEIRLLDGFSDTGSYDAQKANAVLRLYAYTFNGVLMRELELIGKTTCDR